MSDFGVIISIKKKDSLAFSENETSTINKIIDELKSSNEFEDSLGQEFQFSISLNENTIQIMLSEYWLEDETEEEILDFSDTDKDEAEKIVTILKQKLLSNYDYEIYHGAW